MIQREQESCGRRGGIKSDQVRHEKAERIKRATKMLDAIMQLDALTDAEFNEVIGDFTEEQQERLRYIVKPTDKQLREQRKILKKYF